MKFILDKKVYKGWLNLIQKVYKTNSGKKVIREVINRNSGNNTSDSVASLIYDTNMDKYIYVKQHRFPIDRDLVECVAGILEKGQSPTEAIEKEILEEVGYKIDSIKSLGHGYTTPGCFEEKMHLFHIEVSEKISKGGGAIDENEDIEIIEMSKEEVENFDFEDMKTRFLNTFIK